MKRVQDRVLPGIIYYILSSDKRAIIMGHLLETKPLRNRELWDKFNDLFPELAEAGFFGQSFNIGQILRSVDTNARRPRLLRMETESELAYGREVDVMYTSLTEHGVRIQPFVQFGLEFAYRWGDCLMASLGYEQGGAPKIGAARNRIDVLKQVAKMARPSQVSEIAKATKISIRDTLRHAKYLAKGGALVLSSERPASDAYKRVLEYAGTQFSDGLDFDLLEKEVSRVRVKSIMSALHQEFKQGDFLGVDAVFSNPDCPRSDRSRYCLLNFLVGNGVLLRRTKGTTSVRPTRATNSVVNSLIGPIEQALKGDADYRTEIETLAAINRTVRKHVTEVGMQFLNYYKPLAR